MVVKKPEVYEYCRINALTDKHEILYKIPIKIEDENDVDDLRYIRYNYILRWKGWIFKEKIFANHGELYKLLGYKHLHELRKN